MTPGTHEEAVMARGRRIEQRWNERRRVHFDVDIVSSGQPAQQATCRDLGFGGLFVETDPQALSLNEGLDIDLNLRPGAVAGTEHFRLPARVVRLNAYGAGLMFSGLRIENIRALRDVLGANGKSGF